MLMVKIPYGESDFKKISTEGYFYQDRTYFIEKLEQWRSNYPVLLRPRRFGKSLFVSLLQHYYGLEFKEEFQKLFGGLYIGQNPTPLANSYMVLRLEFSRIDTATHESTYQGFLKNVVEGARFFLSAYDQFFTPSQTEEVMGQPSPEGIIKTLFGIVKSQKTDHKIYVLIDEYDHFANELLSFDMPRFKNDVSKNGFVRKFYESLKTATGEGIVDRIFITGVSPVTLDSLTSGFNITSNITTNILFHDAMGFTHKEVEALLYKCDIPAETVPEMIEVLKDWYDGYMFASSAKHHLYNPDMVLYFLLQYGIEGHYPEVMLDTNVVSDYRKIRNIFRIGGAENQRLVVLERLVKEAQIDFPLTQLFNLEGEFTDNDFLSLLFYMGMLSFQQKIGLGWRFRVPNYVIQKLYFEYFTATLLSGTRYATANQSILEAINILFEGNPEPFLKIAEHVLTEHHSNRDDIAYGEKHLQTLIIGLLSPYDAYFIHSEYETGRGYVDIFLERLPDASLDFDVVLELKYVKKSDRAKAESVAEDAKTQLESYLQTERLNRPDVRGFYAVYVGNEIYKWGS